MRAPRFESIWPLALLVMLLALGLAAQVAGLIDVRAALEWARGHTTQWWLAPALVVLQVVLFTFALPGSAVLWLVAPLFSPLAATAIMTLGGTLGALSAYGFARGLTGASLSHLRRTRGYRLLQQESGFLTLCALRLTPGFPNSVINYSAGTLRTPLPTFVAAAVIGLALKAWLYSQAINAALASGHPADLIDIAILGPLAAAAALALGTHLWVRRRP